MIYDETSQGFEPSIVADLIQIVIDSAASFGIASPDRIPKPAADVASVPPRSLLLMSANSPAAITTMVKQYGEYLQAHPDRVGSMAYTLASRRERLKKATYCIVEGSTLSIPPAAVPSSDAVQVAFIFTGQGTKFLSALISLSSLKAHRRSMAGHGKKAHAGAAHLC